MTASVQPTDFNQVTAALAERQIRLDAGEAGVREREVVVELNQGGVKTDRATFAIAVILFILPGLILTNYILDYLRSRELQHTTHAG